MDIGASIASDILEHFGVKGQRWGVRRDMERLREAGRKSNEMGLVSRKMQAKADAKKGSSQPSARDLKKEAKAQTKWEKEAASPKVFLKSYNSAAARMNNTEIPRINSKPKYQVDLTKPEHSDLYKEYLMEYNNTFSKVMTQEASKIVGSSPRGTKLQFLPSKDAQGNHTGGISALLVDEAKHDALGNGINVDVETDSTGHIISITFSLDELTQGTDFVGSFLEHFGVKGMRWGVRRTKNAQGKLEPAELHINPIGQVHKVTGGTNHPTSEDAKRAMGLRQIAKASGTHALSNSEMRELLDRMNLEQNYGRMTESQSGMAKIRKGHSAVREVVGVAKTVNDINRLVKGKPTKEDNKKD